MKRTQQRIKDKPIKVIMGLFNGHVDDLVKQYNKIMGNSLNRQDDNEDTPLIEYFSTYEKSDYETHSYSNLTNIKL